ncbi:hypothetical protein JL722_4709 [Aureococcus anophagefferens]|nr:hypothetical protein JL722_4709 [Aureococcus anophagefferens]
MADDDESMANGFVVLAPKKRPAEAPPQRPPRRSFRLDDDDESMANGFVARATTPAAESPHGPRKIPTETVISRARAAAREGGPPTLSRHAPRRPGPSAPMARPAAPLSVSTADAALRPSFGESPPRGARRPRRGAAGPAAAAVAGPAAGAPPAHARAGHVAPPPRPAGAPPPGANAAPPGGRPRSAAPPGPGPGRARRRAAPRRRRGRGLGREAHADRRRGHVRRRGRRAAARGARARARRRPAAAGLRPPNQPSPPRAPPSGLPRDYAPPPRGPRPPPRGRDGPPRARRWSARVRASVAPRRGGGLRGAPAAREPRARHAAAVPGPPPASPSSRKSPRRRASRRRARARARLRRRDVEPPPPKYSCAAFEKENALTRQTELRAAAEDAAARDKFLAVRGARRARARRGARPLGAPELGAPPRRASPPPSARSPAPASTALARGPSPPPSARRTPPSSPRSAAARPREAASPLAAGGRPRPAGRKTPTGAKKRPKAGGWACALLRASSTAPEKPGGRAPPRRPGSAHGPENAHFTSSYHDRGDADALPLTLASGVDRGLTSASPLARSGARVGVPDGVREWRAVVHAVDLERGDEYSASSELHARYVDAAAPTDDQKLALYRELVGECAFRSTLASKHQAKATRQLVKAPPRASRARRRTAGPRPRGQDRPGAPWEDGETRVAPGGRVCLLRERLVVGGALMEVSARARAAPDVVEVRLRDPASRLHAALSFPLGAAPTLARTMRDRHDARARRRLVGSLAPETTTPRLGDAVGGGGAARATPAGAGETVLQPRDARATIAMAVELVKEENRRTVLRVTPSAVLVAQIAEACRHHRAAVVAQAALRGFARRSGGRRAVAPRPGTARTGSAPRSSAGAAERRRRSRPGPAAAPLARRTRGADAAGAARAPSPSGRPSPSGAAPRGLLRAAADAAEQAADADRRAAEVEHARRNLEKAEQERVMAAVRADRCAANAMAHARRAAGDARAAADGAKDAGLARRALARAEASRRRVAKAEADAARAKAARLAAYAEARAEKEAAAAEEARRAAELRQRADAAASIQRVARGRQLRGAANEAAWREWAASVVQAWYRERLAIHNVELSNAMFMRRRAAEAAEAEAQKVADEAARVADVEAKAAAAREHLEKQRESARDAEDDFYGGDDGEPDEDIDDFDVDDEDDVAMLFTFVRHGRRDKLKKFCARGFDVDLRNAHGHTLAMVAAQNNQKAILKVLYKFGVNINEQDYKGNTALHYANMYGYTRLAEYMVEKLEADETVVNRQGSSCWLTVDDQ